ncbi:MEDS domain-containing protein [Paenibacillus sp. TRM 82003]|nr:MEDS domain-containing protein [Paenibacillus sp. TRM 82003]
MALTSKLNVQSGSHILYFQNDPEGFLQNAVSFIKTGIALEQYIVFIESAEWYGRIRAQLETMYEEHVLNHYLHYVDRDEFYRTHEHFHFERVLKNLNEVIQPYLQLERDVRLWGHVDLQWRSDALEQVHRYECEADLAINEMGYLTVCVYDAATVSAAVQNELLKSHEYLMTDDALVLSNLYKHKRQSMLSFPTLSVQAELETEMDLFKQKLDFVHVVSHEVRNPLTVIKAYARMVKDKLEEERDRDRVQAITDYVDLIDNEIAHIISTEEMLSSEVLWRRRLIAPKEQLAEVFRMTEIKARTQNIVFDGELSIGEEVTMLGNAAGLKLIVSNLLNNAVKYSDEGGRVRCRAWAEEGMLRIDVEDDGVGMTEGQLQRLFRKYEKMNEGRGGQGIGLYMVKRLVDNFDGRIQIRSAPGIGTTVEVQFPLQFQQS